MARDFDGTDDKVQYTTGSPLDTIGAITISILINADNFTSGSNAARIVHKGPNARGYFEIVCDGTTTPDRVGFGRDYVTTDLVKVFNVPSTGTWVNLIFTHDNGDVASGIAGYFDGTAQSSVATADGVGGRTADSTAMAIGGRTSDGLRAFDGRGAEMGVWNRVISAGEIAALADGFSPLFFLKGLVFYAPLIGNLSTEIDLKSGFTATITGSPASPHPRIIYPQGSY